MRLLVGADGVVDVVGVMVGVVDTDDVFMIHGFIVEVLAGVKDFDLDF